MIVLHCEKESKESAAQKGKRKLAANTSENKRSEEMKNLMKRSRYKIEPPARREKERKRERERGTRTDRDGNMRKKARRAEKTKKEKVQWKDKGN